MTKEVNLPAPLAFPSDKRAIPPESPKAARAYSDYESMGPERSLAKLALKYGRKSGYVRQLERWSEMYNWQQRLKDYERKELDERRKKRQKELEDMDKRHADYGRSSLYESIKYIGEHLNDPGTTIAQAVSLMRASYELERLARGAATERIEGDMTMTILPKEYWGISPDEEGSEP